MTDDSSSLEILIRDIQNGSQAEVEAILSDAEKEIGQILQRAQMEASKVRSDITRKAENQANAVRKRILSGAHLEIKKMAFRNQEEIYSAIMKKVTNHLEKYRQTGDYLDFLRKMVVEGIAGLGTYEIQIQAEDREKELLSSTVLKSLEDMLTRQFGKQISLKLSDKTLSESGIVLVTGDGRMRFDNRLSTRLQNIFDSMQWTIMKEFTEGDKKE